MIFYNYLSKVNRILSDSDNQIIHDQPERDSCITIYQNTKTSKKFFFKGVTKSSKHKHIYIYIFM